LLKNSDSKIWVSCKDSIPLKHFKISKYIYLVHSHYECILRRIFWLKRYFPALTPKIPQCGEGKSSFYSQTILLAKLFTQSLPPFMSQSPSRLAFRITFLFTFFDHKARFKQPLFIKKKKYLTHRKLKFIKIDWRNSDYNNQLKFSNPYIFDWLNDWLTDLTNRLHSLK